MKKVLLIALISSTVSLSFAQQQIGNSDFESFGTAFGGEPTNWNSFLSASGGFSGFAGDQIAESADVRPGTSGTKSCQIWSRNAGFGIVANGNVTLGKINMGSTTASNPANYNASITADPDFSEALTDQPDSIVFWAKFTPNGGNGNARMKATLHDSYDYRDPEDGAAAPHIVATAVVNYPNTLGWKRFSIPFSYVGPATVNTHILVTFTTNETPGGGDVDDEVIIDDISLIYNPSTSGLAENDKKDGIIVSMDNTKNVITVNGLNDLKGDYTIFNTLGQDVQIGNISSEIEFNGTAGVYFVHLNTNNKAYTFEILKN